MRGRRGHGAGRKIIVFGLLKREGRAYAEVVPDCKKQHKSPFKWRHFEPSLILLCVRWYCRYSLSYRDLEEMMRERGLSGRSYYRVEVGPALCA